MKLSVDFLAVSTPSPSSSFPFGRQAKLQHSPSTFVAWMGWSLSIDQIYRENDKFKMTRPFNKITTTIYRHPSVEWTSGQTFRPFVPGHICYPILNQIKENRLSRVCNNMSMGKQNLPSRFHVRVVWQFLRKLSIRQLPKFQFPLLCLSRERLDLQRSTGNYRSHTRVRLCRNDMAVGGHWRRKLCYQAK